MVTPDLIQRSFHVLSSSSSIDKDARGVLYIQSNVEDVAVYMKNIIDEILKQRTLSTPSKNRTKFANGFSLADGGRKKGHHIDDGGYMLFDERLIQEMSVTASTQQSSKDQNNTEASQKIQTLRSIEWQKMGGQQAVGEGVSS